MSILANYYASQALAESPFGDSQSLGSSQARGTTPQVEEAQKDNTMTEFGELAGRLLKRQALRRQEIKGVRETGGFEGMTKSERKELKKNIGKGATDTVFGSTTGGSE